MGFSRPKIPKSKPQVNDAALEESMSRERRRSRDTGVLSTILTSNTGSLTQNSNRLGISKLLGGG